MAVLAFLEEVELGGVAQADLVCSLKGSHARGVNLVAVAEPDAVELSSDEH